MHSRVSIEKPKLYKEDLLEGRSQDIVGFVTLFFGRIFSMYHTWISQDYIFFVDRYDYLMHALDPYTA
jgi:hypothetical protein